MDRAEKEAAVESLVGKFGDAPIAVLADYRGLTVAEVTELRAKLREADGELLVAKNTLARLAVAGTDASAIERWLVGPTALAFGYQDPAALAKALHVFAKENEALEVKGAVMEGEVLEAGQVEQLALLPGRDQLRATLLALFNTPATQLVRLLNTPGQQLANLLAAFKDKLEAAAPEDAAVSEDTAAPEAAEASGDGDSPPVAGDNAPGTETPVAAAPEAAAASEDAAVSEDTAASEDADSTDEEDSKTDS